jgi:hypothetical protein
MSPSTFGELLEMITPLSQKEDTAMKDFCATLQSRLYTVIMYNNICWTNSLNIYGLLHKKTNHNTIFERKGRLYFDSMAIVAVNCSSHLTTTEHSVLSNFN